MNLPTLQQAEKVIGEPAPKWIARCFEIAFKLVDRGLVEGVAVYGHWLGPVAPKTHFSGRQVLGFVQHGWVLLPDGRVLDPTRWGFEGVAPYLYVGPSDYYDEGGNRFRMSRLGSPPVFDPDEETVELDQYVLSDGAAWTFVENLLGLNDSFHMADEPGTITREQLFWLANVDPRKLGGHAKAIYAAIEKLDEIALIPIDNRLAVEAGRVK